MADNSCMFCHSSFLRSLYGLLFGFNVLYFETSTLNQFYTQFVVSLV